MVTCLIQVSVFDFDAAYEPGAEDFNASLLKCLLKGLRSEEPNIDNIWKSLKYTMLFGRGAVSDLMVLSIDFVATRILVV